MCAWEGRVGWGDCTGRVAKLSNPEDGEGDGETVAFGGALPPSSVQAATRQLVCSHSAPKAASRC